ncbi:unnamed protein product [Rhizopus microsporus]
MALLAMHLALLVFKCRHKFIRQPYQPGTGSGAKFDKNRFKHDIALFEGEKEANQIQSKKRNAAAVDSNVRSQLLDEIDFFKTTHTVVDQPRKKKKENDKDNDSESEEDVKPKKDKKSTILKCRRGQSI